MAVDDIPDWPARLRAKVYTQFSQSNWAVPTANAIGAGVQSLQNLLVALLSLWSIDPITNDPTSAAYGVGRGVQLDRIGRLVGQPRSGADDDHYRYYLRAKIRANKSNGSPDDLIAVFKAMLGATEIPLYSPGNNASFILQLSTPMTEAVAAIALYFLRIAKQAGVRALLETQELVDSLMFYTAEVTYLTSAVSIGDATIDVSDASAFPTSGDVVLESGTVDAETVTFSHRSDTTLYLSVMPVAAHDAGGSVTLVGSAGLGFPVATYLVSGASIGDSSLDVVDASAFATNDVLIVDQGLANEETVTCTGTGPGILFTTQLTQAHSDGAAVVVVGSGGALERVAQA